MSSIEMKSQIQEYLEQVDDSLVQAVHAMLGTYIAKQNDIVGYDIEGKPKYASEMKQEYRKGLEAVARGEGKSLEEMKAKYGL